MLLHGTNRTRTGRHDIVAMLVLVPLVSVFLSLGAMGDARDVRPAAPVTELPFEGSEESSESFAQLAVTVQRRTTPPARLDVRDGVCTRSAVTLGAEQQTINSAVRNATRQWFATAPVALFLHKRAFLL